MSSAALDKLSKKEIHSTNAKVNRRPSKYTPKELALSDSLVALKIPEKAK